MEQFVNQIGVWPLIGLILVGIATVYSFTMGAKKKSDSSNSGNKDNSNSN